jgi:integrase
MIHRPGGKPPGYFQVRYYLPGRSTPEVVAIGEIADIPRFSELPEDLQAKLGREEWWRPNKAAGWSGSKHVKKIERIIEDCTNTRRAYIEGRPFTRPQSLNWERFTFPRMLELFNEYRLAVGGVESKPTLQKRNAAFAILSEFDKNVHPRSIDQKWVAQFRKWSVPPRIAPSTLAGYVSIYRSAYDYALRKHLVSDNPWLDVEISVPAPRIVHAYLEDELKAFEMLAEVSMPACVQLLFNRTTGFRIIEGCRLAFDDINRRAGVIDFEFTKMKRQELWPLTRSFEALIGLGTRTDSIVMLPGEPIFHYRSTNPLLEALHAACELAKVPKIDSKMLKKNYGSQIQPACGHNNVLYNLLMHHVNLGMSRVGITHYTGPNLKLMAETINETMKPWEDLINRLGYREVRTSELNLRDEK